MLACAGKSPNPRAVEERYPEMLQALEWYIGAGQPDAAYRLASSLVSFLDLD